MIVSFRDRTTEAVFHGRAPKGFPADIERIARRKLGLLDAAKKLGDLRSPPGNRLHPLERERRGQHAISVNDQFRICFQWTEAGPADVEITDYH